MSIFSPQISEHSIAAKNKYVLPFCYSLMGTGYFFAIYYYLKYHAPALALTCFIAASVAWLIPYMDKKFKHMVLTANFIVLIHFSNVFFLTTQTGGIKASAILWLFSIPVLAAFLLNSFYSLIWYLITFFVFTFFYVIDMNGNTPINQLAHVDTRRLYFISMVSCTTLITILCILADTLREKLSVEKEKIMLDSFKLNSMANLGEMAASIAHEINNPLAVIKALNQKLEKNLQSKQLSTEEIAEIIQKNKKHINRIESITGLMGTLSSGKTNANKKNVFQIEVVINSIINLFEERFHHHQIICQFINKTNKSIQANQIEFYQAIYNIILNAIEELEHQSRINKKITIECFENNETNLLSILIKDNGHGVDADSIDKIFLPLYTTKKDQSKGFGLSFANSVILNHHCSLTYSREQDESIFRIDIPTEILST